MKFNIQNPDFNKLGYIVAMANINDKHDRSAPTDYHWKILKCRIIIFTNSSILACPEKNDLKQVHIIFNKASDDYDRLNSLFLKISLIQHGAIRETTAEIFQMCFQYTMIAKVAPAWNSLGNNYLINNRDFLICKGPQEGVSYNIYCNVMPMTQVGLTFTENATILELKGIKINLMQSDEIYLPGELIRVLPSLNKATVYEYHESLPDTAIFKTYNDLRRHWKNIHGYRLPYQGCSYYSIQFWRGEPLLYPKMCVIRNFPIITPTPKHVENTILTRFLNCFKTKMSSYLGISLTIHSDYENTSLALLSNENFADTQAISLCTPTQNTKTTERREY